MRVLLLSNRNWFRPHAEALATRAEDQFLLLENPTDATPERIAEFAPELIFVPFWSHKISAAVWQNHECIIFHMTDLPFGRGGSPLQNLISRGIYQTKISAIRCVDALDAGEVYLKRDFSLIDGSAQELFEKASAIIHTMILEIMEKRPVPTPQRGEPVVFSRRKPGESDLATVSEPDKIYDHIRMLDADGYPNAFLKLNSAVYEFKDAVRQPDGTVLAKVTIRKDK